MMVLRLVNTVRLASARRCWPRSLGGGDQLQGLLALSAVLG